MTRSEWNTQFEKLREFVSREGLQALAKLEPRRLRLWVEKQRERYVATRLGKREAALLGELGVPGFPAPVSEPVPSKSTVPSRERGSPRAKTKPKPEPSTKTPKIVQRPVGLKREARWKAMASQLEQYSLSLPKDWGAEERQGWSYLTSRQSDLHQWAQVQRHRFHKGSLTQEHVDRLNAMGFEWRFLSRRELIDERRLIELTGIRAEYGEEQNWLSHADPGLQRWVDGVARAMGKESNRVSAALAQRLKRLGVTPKAPRNWEPQWRALYERLRRYYETFGHSDVPGTSADDIVLGRWVSRQRLQNARGRMPPGREKALLALEFSWNGSDTISQVWWARYAELKAFQREHGHTNVPQKITALGRFVSRQRSALRAGRMNPRKIELLRKLAFQERAGLWVTDRWRRRFDTLKAWLEAQGKRSLRGIRGLPVEHSEWLTAQRARYREGRLAGEQIEKLEKIGIEWRPKEVIGAPWMSNYRKLVRFKAKNGHTRVPRGFRDRVLVSFVGTQRLTYRKGKLSKDKRRRLEKLGFEWFVADKIRPEWQARYRSLMAFRDEHGHCLVPRKYPPDQGLAEWVAQQKERFRKGKLREAHIDLLKETGFPLQTESRSKAAKRVWAKRKGKSG